MEAAHFRTVDAYVLRHCSNFNSSAHLTVEQNIGESLRLESSAIVATTGRGRGINAVLLRPDRFRFTTGGTAYSIRLEELRQMRDCV
jgi:hypothetical protein